ncbi:hypothetical protein [Methylobacterium iners]|uniref:Uncharacterized protein n=1 Tax=Methylobacterium iners TaxID=418707 RepID=A0ABQ4S2K1_9HYPH|nr:hypothetical protein [Methylobacterium iners]GJD96637.1 hypothetical protein OCOJLMKI_3860 [Methylobacterium iners]
MLLGCGFEATERNIVELPVTETAIAGNFVEDCEENVALLKLFAFFKDTLKKHGILQPDFASIVARLR